MIQAQGQVIQPVGGLRVGERAELLDLSQPEGKHVIERRLVDRAQQFGQRSAYRRAARPRRHDAVALARRVVAADGQRPGQAAKLQLAAAAPAAKRRQKAGLPLGRKAIQHGPHELQQRRFAGLIGPVDHVELFGKSSQAQPAPYAKALDVDFLNVHDGGSSTGASFGD